MKIFVSAGEVSGDQALAGILAALLPALRDRHPGVAVVGLGGAASAAQGLSPLVPLADTAVSGVGDVLASLPRLWRARGAARDCLEGWEGPDTRRGRRPDLALFVDYPGLNLPLAARARALGIPTYYVAPPQAWLYRDPAKKAAGALAALRGAVVHVLFPFERETFAAAAARVVCGHFLAEAVDAGNGASASGGAPAPAERGRVLGLCPGSRRLALRRNLPAWLSALRGAGVLPFSGGRGGGSGEAERVLLLVPPHLAGEAEARCRSAPAGAGRGIEVITDKGRLLRETRWALAFPGTVTLELGLAGVPTGVLACADPLTLAAGRRVLKGPWLGLPNLLLGREAFPEWAGRAARLSAEAAAGVWERLRDPARCDGQGEGARLRALLGPARGSAIAATECLKILEKA